MEVEKVAKAGEGRRWCKGATDGCIGGTLVGVKVVTGVNWL